jgi:hypothetical protein
MRQVIFGLALAAVVLGAAGADEIAKADAPSSDASWCNDFSDPQTLKDNWKFDGSRFLVPRTKFSIISEPTASAGKIMVVEANKATGVMLSAPSKVDLIKTPVMRWRWRVVNPVVLKAGEKEPDDQAAVVYFGDGTLLKQRCVGYRWEVGTPLDTNGRERYAAGMMTVDHTTIRNRTTPVGQWVIEERNVVEDYRKAYGKMPDSYFIISVGANSQYTGSSTRAEIDFIEFIPKREEKTAELKPEQARAGTQETKKK